MLIIRLIRIIPIIRSKNKGRLRIIGKDKNSPSPFRLIGETKEKYFWGFVFIKFS